MISQPGIKDCERIVDMLKVIFSDANGGFAFRTELEGTGMNMSMVSRISDPYFIGEVPYPAGGVSGANNYN